MFKIESDNIKEYLKSSNIIDYNNKQIVSLANKIKSSTLEKSKTDLARKVYEYVRDNISHSGDINGEVVTCRASDVLKEGEGFCYAKSHLLAALLRYLDIPTGFCYQRLILDDEKAPYLIVHGLNAIYIEEIKNWIRVDARGNKKGVNAQFSIEKEMLAFPIRDSLGEEDILTVFKKPDNNVVKALTTYKSVEELFNNLPTELSNKTL